MLRESEDKLRASEATREALETRLMDFSAALGKERAARTKAAHERDEYRKLYELIHLELERVRRHLRAQNKTEKIDATQVQLAFAEVAKVLLPAELAEQIAATENAARDEDAALEIAGEAGASADADERPKGHGRNTSRKKNVCVVRTVVPLTPEECACASCGAPKEKIGEETSERYEWVPASLVCEQTVRVKMKATCGCAGVNITVPSLRDGVVERGLAGPGLMAHIAIAKYAEHMPLYRLEQRFAREGVPFARSTMSDWLGQSADALAPITVAMGTACLAAHRIHTDDTGIPILAKGGTHRGHVWVYVADDDHVVFRYTRRRKSDGPREFLRGYTGYVQADAANLYDRLFGDGSEEAGFATEVGCWAHARRRFFEAQITDPDRARVGLGFVAKLYQADRLAMKQPPSRRTAERQRACAPLLAAFKVWLDAAALEVLPKAPIADAIGYARNQWDALNRFLEDARLKLDNNTAERALRSVAVGRKNWLFAATDGGAERACVFYSLIASCKLHGLNPWEYLRDVLPLVGGYPARNVLDLSPKAWKQKLQNLDAPRPSASPAV